MNKKTELAKNTLIILLGKFCTQFLSFFLLPLYTKYLTTSEYGIYDLINTYLILLVPVISLELSDALFRFLIDARENEKKERKIISSILCGIIVIIVIVSLLAIFAGIFIKIEYLYFIIFDVIAMTFSSFALQSARGLGNNREYACGSIVTAFLTITISGLFLIFTQLKIEGILISIGISNLACYLYIYLRLKLYKLIKIKEYDKMQLKSALKYALPLIPNSISWWIINVSDRTMITAMIGSSANGIYSVANKFSSAFVSLYSVFNLSWSESASLYINDADKDKFFNETINEMLKLFSCIGLGIIGFMPFVFNIFVDANYNEAYNYIPLLILGSMLNIYVGLISAIYVAKKKSKEIAKTSTFAALINIFINLFILKVLGIYGACLSTVIAFLAMFIYRYIDLQKYIKLKLNIKFVISFIIIMCLSNYLYYKNNYYWNIINLCIIISYSFFINVNFIKEIIQIIINKIHIKKI